MESPSILPADKTRIRPNAANRISSQLPESRIDLQFDSQFKATSTPEPGSSAAVKLPRVVIIGAGMSGMLAAIKLREAGNENFIICEKKADVGGVWRDNTYPGLKCDVPAHMFTYSFEPNPGYAKRFATGTEIGKYLKTVYEKHNLRSNVRFNTSIVEANFESGQWFLRTNDDDILVADIVICASGILHNPSFPKIDGIDQFKGVSFHSAQWNHHESIAGKSVGIIGTGSTSVQIVSAIVHLVGQLTVFQRTPHWIFPVPNRRYSSAYQNRMRKWPILSKISRYCYSKLYEWVFDKAVTGSKRMQRFIQWRCENYLQRKVKDPTLRAKLTPDFKAGCKRLILGPGYFDALQNQKTNLVCDGIQRIVSDGVITEDGLHHKLDVLVYATGYQAHNYMRPMKVTGINGMTIDKAWKQSVLAHRSVSIPEFPNFFMILGPYSPIGNFSAISVAEVQVAYLMELIAEIQSGRCDLIEPKKEVAVEQCEGISKAMANTVWLSGCQSWYFDEHGKTTMWPWSFAKFKSEMRHAILAEYNLTKRVCEADTLGETEQEVIFYRTRLASR